MFRVLRVAGITPAWAGKSGPHRSEPYKDQNHPRVGGEKKYNVKDFHPHKGSPPHGRGKGHGQSLRRGLKRITPAWAGKRSPGWPLPPSSRDHPRMGGEKKKGGSPEKSGLGSPPRWRGKDAVQQHTARRVGITPAWAGKRKPCSCHRSESADHPRKAGKSPTYSGCVSPGRDHPRVGGEKVLDFMLFCPKPGSPPRRRGKGVGGGGNGTRAGITPAWAGKSSSHPPAGA